jgi:hypothetical protein
MKPMEHDDAPHTPDRGLAKRYSIDMPHGAAPAVGRPPRRMAERLRPRDSRHLQCCPFWCPRGIPAARCYSRGTGGGSWWRVTAYLLAEDIEILSVLLKVDWWRARLAPQPLVLQKQCEQYLAAACYPALWSRQTAHLCSRLEQQGRHLPSHTTHNGHSGTCVFIINELCSTYLT